MLHDNLVSTSSERQRFGYTLFAATLALASMVMGPVLTGCQSEPEAEQAFEAAEQALSPKTIMVFAPHPDDEVLTSGGRIRAAVNEGHNVKIVVVTNGDVGGTQSGYLREAESVAAAELLGLTEDDVIFLGYGDSIMRPIYDSPSVSQVYTSIAGQQATYAGRGLGGVDYHTRVFGSPGAYNRQTVIQDFKAALSEFQPDEVYSLSPFDNHPDHQATSLFLTEALVELNRAGTPLPTRSYQTLVWQCGGWPEVDGFTPWLPYYPPECQTLPAWDHVTRFRVPLEMRSDLPEDNLKYRAIDIYPSQVIPFYFTFARADEVFWLSDFGTNVAVLANASASSQLTATGQTVGKVNDGVWSGEAIHEWSSNGQQAGAWVQLDWPAPMRINQVTLHDSSAYADNIVAGTLSFSDGTSIPVGELSIEGRPQDFTFPSKVVSWVRFTATDVEGSASLAEMAVFGAPVSVSGNQAPRIVSGPVANLDTISSGTSELSVQAIDLDGDTLQYEWSTDLGSVVGNGATATFTAPTVAFRTAAPITVRISDPFGNSTSNIVWVTITPGESLEIHPSTVLGGGTLLGRIFLDQTAPAGGKTITLSSDAPAVASVPTSVTVPAGASSASFEIFTNSVASETTVNISAGFDEVRSTTIKVTPVVPSALTLSSGSVVGGSALQGTVSLVAPAGPAGEVVQLSSSDTGAVSVPASITIPAGESSGTFSVTTNASETEKTVTVSATLANRTVSNALVVTVPSNSENVALRPGVVVTVSAEESAYGQTGTKAIDGVVDGYPGDYTREWSTGGQGVGAWIQLTWSQPVSIERVVLHDRPNTNDQILAGTLSFSDGASVAVGALPNGGGAHVVNFSKRTVSWVKFEVTQAAGSVGLAEFEVLSDGGENALTLAASSAVGGGALQGTVTVAGPAPAGGSFVALTSDSPSVASVPAGVMVPAGGRFVTFSITTTAVSTATDVTITAQFDSESSSKVFTLLPEPPVLQNVALQPGVTATVSSEAGAYGQTGAKAIDGFIDGYPGDYTREWATGGQGVGAWIQLTWPQPVSIEQVALYDRPNTNDQILGGTLTFSDGASVAVGGLPNSGAAQVVQFSKRTVTWVKFQVTQATGSVGLAEFQVLSSGGENALVLGSSSVVGGTTVQATVTLATPAPAGGSVVELTSDVPMLASVPATVTVPAGNRTATFDVATSAVGEPSSVTITAELPDATLTTSLTLTPAAPVLENVALQPGVTVTVSAEAPAYGQIGTKAVDGVIDGYPGDYTREWATGGQSVGAWIELQWPSPVTIQQIKLYDRPNLTDHVLAATASFSDGTTVNVPQLDNGGAATTVDFAPRTVTSVRILVAAASGYNIGLAELQVFASP